MVRKANSLQHSPVVTYNKHLCKVCKLALRCVREVSFYHPDILRYDHENYSALIWTDDKQRLQDSVEEGCHVCRAIHASLLREAALEAAFDARSVGGFCLRKFAFFENRMGIVSSFAWMEVELDTFLADEARHSYYHPLADLSGCFSVYRKPTKLASSLCFGPPLEGARHNSCDSDVLREYQPVEDMLATPLWELIIQWLGRCSARHRCISEATTGFCAFPTRLVRVETTEVGLRARLVETSGDEFIREPYLTLSHVWGSDRFLTLTSSNVDDFYTEIPIENLRRTFKDAFLIAQRLGFRYIWIDSLCIKQDQDLIDWRYEASRMGGIYRGSMCNIAVAASLDDTGSDNLLHRVREVEDIIPLQFMDTVSQEECQCLPRSLWSEGINNLPLNRRGWVLQERLLAPRVLYFGGKQVFWECSEAIACEAVPQGVRPDKEQIDLKTWRAKTGILTGTSLTIDGGHDVRTARQEYRPWNQIVEVYSGCGLTEERDKLIALSGVAKAMQEVLADQYLAGLWKSNLSSDLLWSVDSGQQDQRQPHVYRAPSWSWASAEGMVRFRMHSTVYTELAEVNEAFTKPAADDPTGEIVGGYIKLRVIMRKLTVSGDWTAPEYSIQDSKLECIFDSPKSSLPDDVYCIILGVSTIALEGLLLISAGSGSQLYQRIGIFSTITDSKRGAFADVLDLPRELYHASDSVNLLDEYMLVLDSYVSGEIDYDHLISAREEVVERARNYIKPFMELITIV